MHKISDDVNHEFWEIPQTGLPYQVGRKHIQIRHLLHLLFLPCRRNIIIFYLFQIVYCMNQNYH
jgi:hypothetical protein